MTSTINANIFDKNNVTLLNEIDKTKSVNEAETQLVSILKHKEKNTKVLDYQATDRSVSILKLKNIIYTGVNVEYAFINDESNITYIKDVTEARHDHQSDIVVSIDSVHRKAEPIKFIKEIISLHANETYIIFPCSNVHGMTLKDDIRIERLSNDATFINNIYSHEAVNKIAELVNMTAQIFKVDDINDVALLSLVKEVKAVAKTETIKEVDKEIKLTKIKEIIEDLVINDPKISDDTKEIDLNKTKK